MRFSALRVRHLLVLGVLAVAACSAAVVPALRGDDPVDTPPIAHAQPAASERVDSAARASAPMQPTAVSSTAIAQPSVTADEEEVASEPAPAPAAVPAPGPTVPTATATAAPPPPAALQPVQPPAPLAAFRPANGRQRVVVLDPGHGGPEVGSAGAGVAEKDVNLRIALMLREMLQADGMRVILTRDSDRRAAGGDSNGTGANSPTRLDLQERIDIANRNGADLFISIHNNGSPNAGDSGTEVWWDGRRPFAAYNQALAADVLDGLLSEIRAAGWPTINRGMKEDTHFRVFQGRSFPIFVLGPPRTGTTTSRATLMPAVLGESLFLSNGAEAAQLARPAMQAAIAQGYRDGINRYFSRIDSGQLTPPVGGFPAEVPNFYDVRPPASASGSG